MTRICDTPNCPNSPRQGNGRRCGSCANYKQKHGRYPERKPPAQPVDPRDIPPPTPYGPAMPPDWTFTDAICAAIFRADYLPPSTQRDDRAGSW